MAYCLTKCFSGHSEQLIQAHGFIGASRLKIFGILASGFDFFSVFLNPQCSVGSEHKFFTQLLVADTTTRDQEPSACDFDKKPTDRTQILLVEHIFATHFEPKPYYVQDAFLLAGLVPLTADAVLSRCKTRKQRPSIYRFYLLHHLVCVVLFLI